MLITKNVYISIFTLKIRQRESEVPSLSKKIQSFGLATII